MKMLLFAALSMQVLSSIVLGEIPELINYQGRLVDGTNLVNGSYEFRFAFYKNPTGSGGLLYKEYQTLTVQDGLYSTLIGLSNSTPGDLKAVFTNSPVYLDVEVDGTALTPREQMSAAGYAMNAGGVNAGAIATAMLADDAVTADKLDAGSVAPVHLSGSVSNLFVERNGDSMTGALSLPSNGLAVGTDQLTVSGGKVGVGTASPGNALTVYGATANLQIDNTAETEAGLVFTDHDVPASQYAYMLYNSGGANMLNLYIDSATPLLTLDDSQRVGIGNTAPGAKLHVEGDGTAQGGLIDGSPDIVAYFKNTIASRHSSISVDGKPGFDAAVYLAGNGSAVWDFRHDASDSSKLNFRYHGGGANATRMLITTNGNVGVGVSSPSERLDVGGNVETTGNYKYSPAKTYYKNLPPTAFNLRSNDGGDAEYEINDLTGSLKITSTAPSQHLYLTANVDLPQGASVQELEVFYYDNTPSAGLWVGATLYRRYMLDDTTLQEMADIPYEGAASNSDTFQSRSDTTISNGTINNQNYMYLLYVHYAVSSADAGLGFFGTQIRYILDTVAP